MKYRELTPNEIEAYNIGYKNGSRQAVIKVLEYETPEEKIFYRQGYNAGCQDRKRHNVSTNEIGSNVSNVSNVDSYDSTIAINNAIANVDNKGGMGGKEGKKFTPPTETEVLAYAKQMNDLAGTGGFKCTEQQALLFHAYFERMKWKDKNGTPVYEWEKAFKYWVRRDEQNSYSKEQQDGIPDAPRYV